MNARPSLLGHQLNRKSVREQPFNDSVWAITFCDLITLLFCFFLTMVSTGPMGKAHQVTRTTDKSPEEPADTNLKTGTSLAITGTGVQKRVFELHREELSRITQGGTSETLEEAKKIIMSEGYDNRRVTITVAPEDSVGAQGERWLSIIQRLSELQRQVFDAQPKTLLKLRISEPYPVPARTGPDEQHNPGRIPVLIEIEDVSN